MSKANLYPHSTITRNMHPNRLYAFPIFGLLLKVIMLIPQYFELTVLGIAANIIIFIINPFVVLFTGKYWDVAYELGSGMIKLSIKIVFFIYGLTDTYPGFDFTIHDSYKIEIEKPKTSSRFFAIPLFGLVVRILLLIPFVLYEGIIRAAAQLSVIGASFPAFFTGNYPETSYELARDSVRLNTAQVMYLFGLSDTYPSFWISMNHKTAKWILIIFALLCILLFGGKAEQNAQEQRYKEDVRLRNHIWRNDMMQNEWNNPDYLKTGY